MPAAASGRVARTTRWAARSRVVQVPHRVGASGPELGHEVGERSPLGTATAFAGHAVLLAAAGVPAARPRSLRSPLRRGLPPQGQVRGCRRREGSGRSHPVRSGRDARHGCDRSTTSSPRAPRPAADGAGHRPVRHARRAPGAGAAALRARAVGADRRPPPAVNQFGLPVDGGASDRPARGPGYGAVPVHNSLAAGYDDAPAVWDPTAALATHTQGRTRARSADVRPARCYAAGILAIVAGVIGAARPASSCSATSAPRARSRRPVAASRPGRRPVGLADAFLIGHPDLRPHRRRHGRPLVVLGSLAIGAAAGRRGPSSCCPASACSAVSLRCSWAAAPAPRSAVGTWLGHRRIARGPPAAHHRRGRSLAAPQLTALGRSVEAVASA